jgi:hypothetical protein
MCSCTLAPRGAEYQGRLTSPAMALGPTEGDSSGAEDSPAPSPADYFAGLARVISPAMTMSATTTTNTTATTSLDLVSTSGW